MKRSAVCLVTIAFLCQLSPVSAQKEGGDGNQTTKGVQFPCFCPEIDYFGGTLGKRHESNCTESESYWEDQTYDDKPQYCDSGGPDPCDCVAAAYHVRDPKNRTSNSPPLDQPLTLEEARLENLVGGKDGYKEMHVVYFKLMEEMGVMKIKAHQVLYEPPNEPAILRWVGVEIKRFPPGVGNEPPELRRRHSGAALGRNEYKATPHAGQILVRVGIGNPGEGPQPKFLVLGSRSVPPTPPNP